MKKFISPFVCLLFISFSLSSCGPEKSTEQVAMENEIMRIHDEVMDKMGEVKKLQGKMEQVMISEGESDFDRIKEAQVVRKNLEEAHDDMMAWMRQYNPNKHSEKEKAMAYLTEQEKEIILVADKINNSITSAKGILDASE